MGTQNTEHVSSYIWDAPQQGSVQCFEALFELTESARELLAVHPVIEIPRGVLNHAKMDLTHFGSNRVESDLGGAAPHTHDWPVRLVSTPATKTSTLIFTDARQVGRAILQLASEPASSDLRRIANTHTDIFGEVAEILNAPIEKGDTEKAVLRAIDRVRDALAHCAEESVILGFLRELQIRLQDCMHEVQWKDTDILMFGPGIIHARDVRQVDQREAGEGLMVFSMRFP
ncbi:hypothetical protein A3C37_00760 [Candidatus Peribacteria bacterium RIFCSPHIGHO2_02_FULL_53_20]|nr:MAG: hypothetical protein A3C37_00760 [Candidatus Peribacteria bacterium RIFCSPHIGHO2_02_FULL_53_20]